MKKLRKAIALLIAVALLIEPCSAFGTMKKVQAAETTKVYEQMKVTDISTRPDAEGQDKDALEIGDAGVKLITDVTVEVPEGWAVAEIGVNWETINNDEFYDGPFKKYDISAQPENNVYSLEFDLHKYMKSDIYYLSDVYVMFVEIANTKNYYYLEGAPAVYGQIASEANPLELEWYIVDSEFDFYEDLESTNYTGTADYTILNESVKDNVAPKVTALKMKTTGVLDKNTLAEIDVTVKENGSGIQYIYIMTETSDWDEDELYFEAEAMEKYTGTQKKRIVNF